MVQAGQQVWESAEVTRSAFEAAHTPDDQLLATARNTARYLAPPADTEYPLEYAYHLLGDVRGRTVVDFGCGSGENTILLVHRQAQVIGIDISPDLIALAKRRLALNGLPNAAQFHVGSAYHLPVESNSVDVVFGIAILHHLDLEQAATEVHRVLKPGGRGIFQEPVRNSPVLRAIRGCIPYKAPDVSPFERPLRSTELASFASHFSSSFERAFSLPFVNVVQVVPMLRRFVPSAYQYDKRVLGAVPKLERYAGVRVMQVTK